MNKCKHIRNPRYLNVKHILTFLKIYFCNSRTFSVSQNQCSRNASDSSIFEGPALNKETRKEMFYLTTHSTHFIYGYIGSKI